MILRRNVVNDFFFRKSPAHSPKTTGRTDVISPRLCNKPGLWMSRNFKSVDENPLVVGNYPRERKTNEKRLETFSVRGRLGLAPFTRFTLLLGPGRSLYPLAADAGCGDPWGVTEGLGTISGRVLLQQVGSARDLSGRGLAAQHGRHF